MVCLVVGVLWGISGKASGITRISDAEQHSLRGGFGFWDTDCVSGGTSCAGGHIAKNGPNCTGSPNIECRRCATTDGEACNAPHKQLIPGYLCVTDLVVPNSCNGDAGYCDSIGNCDISAGAGPTPPNCNPSAESRCHE